jgi:ribosomal protein L34E
VALLRRADSRAPKQILRDRIASLRQRAGELATGETTPRHLKDDALWMCPSCQRIMADVQQLAPREMQRRIHEEVRRLERDVRERAS